MITVPHIAAVFIAAVAYCVLCVLKPTKRCRRCKATPGRSLRYAGIAGPMGKCRKCRGHKKHPRFGASAVHWFIWSAIVEPIRERRNGGDQHFAWAPPRASHPASTPSGSNYAARLRAAQRADRLRAFQARLQARTAPRAWQFA